MSDAVVAVVIAVAVCLIVLIPLFLLATLGRRWIQRAPTDNAAKFRRNIFWISLVAALVIWSNREALAETITESKLWRRVSGTCSIVLLNKSGVEVTNLDLTLRATGDPESHTNHTESMQNEGRTWIKTRADEFKVENLTGSAGSYRFSFKGAAKKGERLVIAIEPGGKIASHVE
jgi:hypothetical protein